MEIRNHIYKFEVDNKETGKYIKQLRKNKGWTSEELAEKLYCSPKTISSWETGVRMPSLDMLIALSNLFEVSVHSLLLPLDNCSCGYIGHYPTQELGYGGGDLDFMAGTLESAGGVFQRREYLLQRLANKVLSEKDIEEIFAVSETLQSYGSLSSKESFLEKINYNNTNPFEIELNFFKALAEYSIETEKIIDDMFASIGEYTPREHNKITFKYLFSVFARLYYGENLDKVLPEMSIIEKSVLFTAAIINKNVAKLEMTEKLYKSGGCFINGILKNASSGLVDAISNEIPYEPNGEKFYWNTSQHELENYFDVIGYVTYYIYKSNPIDVYDLLIIQENENFDEYVQGLHKRGEI